MGKNHPSFLTLIISFVVILILLYTSLLISSYYTTLTSVFSPLPTFVVLNFFINLVLFQWLLNYYFLLLTFKNQISEHPTKSKLFLFFVIIIFFFYIKFINDDFVKYLLYLVVVVFTFFIQIKKKFYHFHLFHPKLNLTSQQNLYFRLTINIICHN